MSDAPERDDPAPNSDAQALEPNNTENSAQTEPDPAHLRLLEAVLFSSDEPLTEEALAERLPNDANVPALLASLADHYANHGINLVRAGGRWLFRTAEDLSEQLRVHKQVPRRLSRAAMETLAIIAYHQPVTRAEIEEIRGVGLSRGTLDLLLESNWIAPKGRRRTAGRPSTWGTTPGFLVDFGLDSIKDLPGLDDLKAAGLLDKRPAMQISEFVRDGEEEEEGAPGDDREEVEIDETSEYPVDDAPDEPDTSEESGGRAPGPPFGPDRSA